MLFSSLDGLVWTPKLLLLHNTQASFQVLGTYHLRLKHMGVDDRYLILIRFIGVVK